MFRKILLTCAMLALVLCAPAAAQEGDYVPGRDTAAYFLNALSDNEIITLRLKPSMPAYYDSLAPDEQTRTFVRNGRLLLNASTLSVGAGLTGSGLRVELGVLCDGESDVTADAALTLTRQSLTIESSLIPGECAVLDWATLLTLIGADEADAQAAIAMLGQDPQLLTEQIIQIIAPAAEMTTQMITPYIEIIAEFFDSLPVVYRSASNNDQFPTLAKDSAVFISQKDLGTLLTGLTEHLEQDSLSGMLLTSLLSQQTEIPVSNAAELCALLRQISAALTDTSPLITFFMGEDAAGNPLYATLQLAIGSESISLAMKSKTDQASGDNGFLLDLIFTNAQGVSTTPFRLSTVHIPGAFSGFEAFCGDIYLAVASRKERTPDESGQFKHNTKYNLTLFSQDDMLIDLGYSIDAYPNAGGETFMIITSASGSVIPEPFLCASEFIFTPGADEADGTGTIMLVTESGAEGALSLTTELITKPYRAEAARPLTITKIAGPDDEATNALFERAAAGLEAFRLSLQSEFSE